MTYLKKIHISEEFISYEYGRNKEIMDGLVKVPFNNNKKPIFIRYNQQESNSTYYSIQAVLAICKFIKDRKFPDTYVRATY